MILSIFYESNDYFEAHTSALATEYSSDVILTEAQESSNIIVAIFRKIAEFFRSIFQAFRKFIREVSDNFDRFVERNKIKYTIKQLQKLPLKKQIIYSDIWSYEKHMSAYIIQLKKLKSRVLSCTIYDYALPKVVDGVVADFKSLREMYTRILGEDLKRQVHVPVEKIIGFLAKSLNHQSLSDDVYIEFSSELSDLYDYFDDLTNTFDEYLKSNDNYRPVKNLDPSTVNMKTQALKNEVYNHARWAKDNKLIFTEYVLKSACLLVAADKLVTRTVPAIKATGKNMKTRAEMYMNDEEDMTADKVLSGAMGDITDTIGVAKSGIDSSLIPFAASRIIQGDINKRKMKEDYITKNMIKVN